MLTADQIVTEALKDWLDKVDAGATDRDVAAFGLCENVKSFTRKEHRGHDVYMVHDCLKQRFIASGLDGMYPFGGEHLFFRELVHDSYHLNEQRVQWVRDQLKTKD